MLRPKSLLSVVALCAALCALAASAGAGEVDVPALLNTAKTDTGRNRVEAIHKLASLPADKMQQHKVIDVLLKDIATSGEVQGRVRIAAVDELGNIVQRTLPAAKQEVLSALLSMAKSANEDMAVRKAAARALGKICNPQEISDISAIKAVEAIAADKGADVALRAIAIGALGAIGFPGSFGVLKSLIGENDPVIREAVAPAFSSYIAKGVAELDVVTIKQLVELARDKTIDTKIRIGFIDAVGRGGDKFTTIAPELIPLLAEAEDEIVIVLAVSLARMKDERAVQPLAEAMKRFGEPKDAKVRLAIVEALGEFYEVLGSSRTASSRSIELVTSTLVKSLNDDADSSVSAAAAFALGNCPRKLDRILIVGSLIEALKDNDAAVKTNSLDSLRLLTDKDYGDDYQRWADWYVKNKSKLSGKSQ